MEETPQKARVSLRKETPGKAAGILPNIRKKFPSLEQTSLKTSREQSLTGRSEAKAWGPSQGKGTVWGGGGGPRVSEQQSPTHCKGEAHAAGWLVGDFLRQFFLEMPHGQHVAGSG